ncbi:MAG: universal stress protein [Kofleriaceae bacterium]
MPIICGTDLSEAGRGAVDVACALAGLRGGDSVVVIHAVDPDAPEAAREQLLATARTALDAFTSPLASVTLRTELVVGPTVETLVGYADTEGSDLIVIAASSKSNPGGRLGNTAAQVIGQTHVPVVVVRDPAPWLAYARRERALRVLLGIDESATCDLGVQWTHALRARGPVEVVLGAIYYPDDAAARYGIEARALVDRSPEAEQLLERDLIRRFAGEPTGVVARPRRGLGRIGDHMLELAREEHVDVIVVGTGQKTGLGRLGSVSSVIVNEATQSVVCVPPQAAVPTVVVPRLGSALVATDLSPFANRAVAYAFAMTPPTGEIHIVHVIKGDAETDDAELVTALRALAPEGSKQTVHAYVVRGEDAAIALAQCAARFGVDVICISSHGRSGIARALVGSVADRLLRATRLPVLVLRPA